MTPKGLEWFTYVYTCNGWKVIRDLREGELILTLNPYDKLSRFNPILKVYSQHYSGKMFGWQTKSMVSPLMTLDYLLWMSKWSTRKNSELSLHENAKQFCEKVPVYLILNRKIVIRKDIPWPKNIINKEIQIGKYIYKVNDLFGWLGWLATDGYIVVNKVHRCEISQCKQQNFSVIRQLMNNLFGCRWRENGPYGYQREMRFIIYDKDLYNFAKENIGQNNEERYFSRWLMESGVEPLAHFFNNALLGDGRNRKHGSEAICAATENVAEQYQIIGCLLGKPGNVFVDDTRELIYFYHGWSNKKQDIYTITFSQHSGGSMIEPHNQYLKDYNGMIYNLEVNDGIIFVKKLGHPFWIGS